MFSFATFFNTMDAHYIDFVTNTFKKIEAASTVSTTSNIVAPVMTLQTTALGKHGRVNTPNASI
jgi:hypothetical protein